MTSVKQKRKREEIYEEMASERGEAPLTQALRFLGWLLSAPFVWSWRQLARLVTWTFRLCAAVTRWTLRSAWQAAVWTARLPFHALAWLWQLVFGPPVRFSDPRYAEIYALIARRYRRRSRFITHFFVFAITNSILWLGWLYDRQFTYNYYPSNPFTSTPILFTLLWSMVLVFHYIRMKHGVEEDQAIEQAIEREREWQARQRRDDYGAAYGRLADDAEPVELRPFMDEPLKRKNR